MRVEEPDVIADRIMKKFSSKDAALWLASKLGASEAYRSIARELRREFDIPKREEKGTISFHSENITLIIKEIEKKVVRK